MLESGFNGVPLLPERPKKNIVAHGRHLSLARGRSIRAALGLLFTVAVNCAQVPQVQPGNLRVLTTAREAHGISVAESRRGYPVHLRAVVTYYDPYIDPRHGALFVHDGTFGVFVSVPKAPILPIHAGTIIDITGVSGPGDFAPIVVGHQIKVIEEGHLPARAPLVSMGHLLTGADDGQWVEIEGLVHSIAASGENVTLSVAMSDGVIGATTVKETGRDYSGLIDATVRIRGSSAPIFTKNRQMTGSRLFFPNLAQVNILAPAPADPYALTVRPIDSLLQFTPNIAFLHRAHVRGRVTLQRPGQSLCIQDAGQGLCVQTAQKTPIALGDVADVVGFPAANQYAPTMTDAVFRWTSGAGPVAATPITAEQALRGEYDAGLIQIEGRLIGVEQAGKEPALVVSSGGVVFPAMLPDDGLSQSLRAWKEGSKLRLTGICAVQADSRRTIMGEGATHARSFRVMLRSPADVTVLETPSWWTPGHALGVLGLVFAVTLAVLGWVLVLRHRVKQI